MLHDVPDPYDLDYHGPRVIYRFVMALFDTARSKSRPGIFSLLAYTHL